MKGQQHILWAICLSMAIVTDSFADGVGDSKDRPPRIISRPCPQPCTPACASAITVNCQPSAPADAGKSKEAGATAKEGGEWLTHVIDKGPEYLWWLLGLIALFYFGRRWPEKLMSSLKKFKAGGVEVEFDAVRAREAEADFHTALDSFTKLAQKEYDRNAKRLQLSELLRAAVKEVVDLRPTIQQKAYRATVYVPDIVFERFIYQLLDYHPEPGGRGRRFSERYGIIGRCWRTRESIGEGDAVRVGGKLDPKAAVYALTREWGMTKAEAENSRRARPSVLCVLLLAPGEANVPVGFLFMDSEQPYIFGQDTEQASDFAKSMEKKEGVVALAKAVERAMEELRKGAAHIEVT